MLNTVAIGQFYPTGSLLHRLDGRAKITCLLLFYVVLFAAHDTLSYVLVTVLGVALIVMSRVPLRIYWKSSRIIVFFVLFITVFNAFFTPGEVIWQWYMFQLTVEGLIRAAQMAVRLVLLITVSSVLTFTTSSMALTDSIEAMLSPLKRIKFPAHELAMMMSIALRFIPTFVEEGEKIIKAQRSRGVDFGRRGLAKLRTVLIPMVVPLFMSAFRCSEELANAMNARAYRGGVGRTRLRELRLCGSDIAAMLIFVLLAAAALAYRLWS